MRPAQLTPGGTLSFADGAVDCFTFLLARHMAGVLCNVISEAIRDVKQTRRGCRSTTSSSSNTLLPLIHDKARIEVYAIRIQDSGFRRCLFNIITFQICLHIEHIVYLDLGSYQAFSSWWGWSTLNLKTVSWFTTDSVVNILPRVKKTEIILIKHHWLRLETSTKAL